MSCRIAAFLSSGNNAPRIMTIFFSDIREIMVIASLRVATPKASICDSIALTVSVRPCPYASAFTTAITAASGANSLQICRFFLSASGFISTHVLFANLSSIFLFRVLGFCFSSQLPFFWEERE